MRLREPPVTAPASKPRAAGSQAARQSRPTRADAARVGVQLAALHRPSSEADPAQLREAAPHRNDTGLPDRLKAGVESLSGLSLDDVKVHYGSPKPAQFQALAYAQGSEIHVAPGQEKHLAHEAWHVVQQKQGRVVATQQMKGVGINADQALEREADAMAVRCLDGLASPAPAVARVRSPGGVAQLRKANPYGDATALAGGSTAHHILPDELLTTALSYLTDDNARAVSRKFLPAFDNLTMRQLAEGGDLTIRYGEGAGDQKPIVNANVVRAANADAVYATTFGALNEQQKAKAMIAGLSFANFKTEYGKLQQGQQNELPAEAAAGIIESFFEWQAGNLMLGPASQTRLEPGDKNEFDSDAAFILGNAKHVDELGKIYSVLRALESKWDEVEKLPEGRIKRGRKAQIRTWVGETLGKMATLNAGVASVKANDEQSWTIVKNQKQAELFGQLEGKKRPGYKDGLKMPTKLIEALIAPRKGNTGELAAFLDQLRQGIVKKDAGKLLAGLPMNFVRSGKAVIKLALAGYEDNAVEVEEAKLGHSIVEAANGAVRAAYDAI